jgi:Flp pilus assembly protein TadD
MATSAEKERPKGKKSPKRGRSLAIRLVVVIAVLLVAIAGLLWFLKLRSVPYRLKRLEEEARLDLRIGKTADAVKALEAAVALAPPELTGVSIELAQAYDALRRPDAAEKALRAALARAPTDVNLAVALATRLLARGRGAEADALLEPLLGRIRAMTDKPARGRALITAGRAAAKAGSLEKAEGIFSEAALGADRAPALTALGEVLAENGQLANAEKACREAHDAAPDDTAAALSLAHVLDLAGRQEEAIRTLEAASKGAAPGERKADLVPALAELLIKAGRGADARALADDVVKDARGLATVAYVRGLADWAEGDDAGAEADFERMAQLVPGSPRPRLLMARVALRRGAQDRAREAYEAALAVSPGEPEAELGLLALEERAQSWEQLRAHADRLLADPATRGPALRALLECYARERDPQGGLARLEALRKQFPGDAYVRLNEAVFRILAGDAERGIADLSRLAEEEPDLPGAFALLASAREQNSGALEAIELLARLAAKDPRLAPARIVLASIYERIGRADLAVREADAALKDRPDLREAHALRGRLAAQQGDLARAREEYELLLAEKPRDARIATTLAELKVAGGDAAGAVRLLAQAHDALPADAGIMARLARAQAIAGEPEKALASYEAARRLDPKLAQAHEDGGLLLAKGDVVGAQAALRRALDTTGDARFGAGLAAALAIGGDAAKAVEPLLAWRVRASGLVEGAVAHAMVLALAGDRTRAEAILQLAPVPAEVRAAAAAVRAGAGGGLDQRTRLELEVFALGVLGFGPEVQARVERVAREPTADALLAWWALRGLAAARAPAPGTRLALARRLAELAPTDAAAGIDFAEAQLAAGDKEGELATLEALRERFPDRASVALALGLALERKGDAAAAIEQYARAAAVPQPSPVALNNLAYLLASDASRLPIAIAEARRAAQIAPRTGEILDTLGWLLFLDGQLEEARAALARAASAAPAQPTIRYHLALALDADGETSRAANHLEVALLSSGRFPEEAAARALLERLRGELAYRGAAAAGEARPLAIGAPVEAALGKDGLAVLKIAAADGPREARLRFRAPAGAPAVLSILKDGRTYKRLAAAAGEEVVLPRLALAPGGHVLIARASGDDAAAAGPFLAALEEPDAALAAGFEVEPNETAAEGPPLAIGASRAGGFDGQADRDCVRLAIGAGERACASVEIGPRGDARVEVLVVTGSIERIAKVVRVRAGASARIDGLTGPARGALALRLSAGSPLARAADGAPAGLAPDWKVALSAASGEGDAEPNDRMEDAIPLAVGSGAARGTVGPGDEIDWYRVAAGPGEVLKLALREAAPRADGRPALALELWERTPDRPVFGRRYVVAGGALEVPRWRTPREGELLVAVLCAQGATVTAGYEIAAERAPAVDGAVETEPNDRPDRADTVGFGVPFRGALDVAGDRDWVRIPAIAPGAALSLSLRAAPEFADAVVSVFSRPDRDPVFVASFDASGGALEVPALRLPEGPAAIVVAASGAGVPGAYELEMRSVPIEPGMEVEPNDDAANAVAVSPGRTLRGRISGRADRDVLRVDARRPLTVRASGAAPVAVTVRRPGASAQVVAPGEKITIPPEALQAGAAEGGESALVEISAPRREGAEGRRQSLAEARAGATYEVGSEGTR